MKFFTTISSTAIILKSITNVSATSTVEQQPTSFADDVTNLNSSVEALRNKITAYQELETKGQTTDANNAKLGVQELVDKMGDSLTALTLKFFPGFIGEEEKGTIKEKLITPNGMAELKNYIEKLSTEGKKAANSLFTYLSGIFADKTANKDKIEVLTNKNIFGEGADLMTQFEAKPMTEDDFMSTCLPFVTVLGKLLKADTTSGNVGGEVESASTKFYLLCGLIVVLVLVLIVLVVLIFKNKSGEEEEGSVSGNKTGSPVRATEES